MQIAGKRLRNCGESAYLLEVGNPPKKRLITGPETQAITRF